MMGHRHEFRDYALLGDDIVICNKQVAKRYLKLMEKLGVEVNLTKSLISSHALEFAKRFIFKGIDVSPFSAKEFNSLGENLAGYFSFSKKFGSSLPSLLSTVGAGYKFLGSYRDKSIRTLGPVYRTVLLY